MSGDIIQLNPEAFQTELKGLVKNSIEETLNAMLDEEAKKLVNGRRQTQDLLTFQMLELRMIFMKCKVCKPVFDACERRRSD